MSTTATVTDNDIIDLTAELFHIDPAKISSEHELYTDLNFDSLDMIELVMACEDKFGVQIEDEAADRITTVHSLGEVIRKAAQ